MSTVGRWHRGTLLRLPILKKDLTELAAQRRTYVTRFLYAFVLFVTACTLFYANIGLSAGAGETLGRGGDHFQALLRLQLVALYLIVPLLTAGAITGEKERETLALLLLTTLTPRQIVLQKFASRMTPILSFVFLSFPLLAITYTFGGITIPELSLGIVVLIYTCLELGAFAILCSAHFRTTVQALAATYLGCPLFAWICPGSCTMLGGAAISGASVDKFAYAIASTGFSTFFVVACLSLAESVLVSRAFVPQRNYLLEFFHWLDRRYEKLNVMTGGIVLVPDHGVLPRRDAIRWRETSKKSLGTFRYLFRVLVVIELPVLFVLQWIRTGPSGHSDDGTIPALLYLVWIASVLLVAIHSASLISQERSHQTLGVLLATPLNGRRILREKLAGVHRLMAVLVVPFATIFAFEHWWYSLASYDYLATSAATVGLYLPVLQWMGLSVGLRVRSQLTAIIVTLVVVAAWIGGLAAVPPLMRYLQFESPRLSQLVVCLSPSDMILAIQNSAARGLGYEAASPWQLTPILTIAHFAFYAACYFVLRMSCLRHVDRRLGRIPEPATHGPLSSL